MTAFECSKCGKTKVSFSTFTTGYGVDRSTNKPVCYACCAEDDKKQMREKGKIMLYLSGDKVTNWPGSLSFPVQYQTKGRHNIASTRYDVWFNFEGKVWHGVQYGDMTQIVHCAATKGR